MDLSFAVYHLPIWLSLAVIAVLNGGSIATASSTRRSLDAVSR